MSDMPAPVAEHLESTAEDLLEDWFRSQQYDLKAKRRTVTLKSLVISAYIKGLLDGAKAQHHDPQDLSPIIE